MVLGPSKRCRRRSQTWEYEVTHMVTLLSSYATGNASSFWEGRPLYDPHQFGDDAGARESGKCRPPLVLMRCGAVSASVVVVKWLRREVDEINDQTRRSTAHSALPTPTARYAHNVARGARCSLQTCDSVLATSATSACTGTWPRAMNGSE